VKGRKTDCLFAVTNPTVPIDYACDMGKYMIEKDLKTDEEIIDAWHKRFELFN